jgi:hypothetical protein
MIDAKYVAEEANDILKKMIADWQEKPLMFFSEHDVQAEIYSRLNCWLKMKGLDFVEGRTVENEKYKKKCRIEIEAKQKWHRLHCEVHLKCKSEERPRGIRPDVIIWDDLEGINEDQFIDIVYQFSNNWPMIWACEIKYHHGGAKQADDFKIKDIEDEFKKDGGQDKDKKNLHLLLEQEKEEGKDKYFGTKYATILNVYRRRVDSDKCCCEEKDTEIKNSTEIKIINAFLAVEENNKPNDTKE